MLRLARLARDRDLPTLALIAVAGTLPFWLRLGFSIVAAPGLAPTLASYDAEAQLMRLTLGGPGETRR